MGDLLRLSREEINNLSNRTLVLVEIVEHTEHVMACFNEYEIN